MTPVISPWAFYLMSVVDEIDVLCVITLAIGIIVFVVAGIWMMVDKACGFEDEDVQNVCGKILKKVSVLLVITGLIVTVVPGSTTITKMLIAQNVTYERVEMATDTVQSVYEDIMGLFAEEDDE